MSYLILIFSLFFSLSACGGNCDYPDDRDSAGRRCGGRAASVRPGGKLGGDGRYIDSKVGKGYGGVITTRMIGILPFRLYEVRLQKSRL